MAQKPVNVTHTFSSYLWSTFLLTICDTEALTSFDVEYSWTSFCSYRSSHPSTIYILNHLTDIVQVSSEVAREGTYY